MISCSLVAVLRWTVRFPQPPLPSLSASAVSKARVSFRIAYYHDNKITGSQLDSDGGMRSEVSSHEYYRKIFLKSSNPFFSALRHVLHHPAPVVPVAFLGSPPQPLDRTRQQPLSHEVNLSQNKSIYSEASGVGVATDSFPGSVLC